MGALLLGKAEKEELRELVLLRLAEHHDRHGPAALLEDGVRVVVQSDGVVIDHGEAADPLAAVPVRTLLTALCYARDGDAVVPREALVSLAAEASEAAAAQINRIVAG